MNTITNTIRGNVRFELHSDQREDFTVDGKPEHHDCTVRALKSVTAVPYRDAHEFMKGLGRRNRSGMNVTMLDDMTRCDHVYGFKVTKLTDTIGYRLTLGNIVRRYPKGRYYIVITGHAIGMRDGVVIDSSTSGSGCRVKAVYKFTLTSELEGGK
jgi:hypothetical protein